jgi:hypothetical protein
LASGLAYNGAELITTHRCSLPNGLCRLSRLQAGLRHIVVLSGDLSIPSALLRIHPWFPFLSRHCPNFLIQRVVGQTSPLVPPTDERAGELTTALETELRGRESAIRDVLPRSSRALSIQIVHRIVDRNLRA